MPSLERRFWSVLLLTLVIGLLPRNWDYKKPTWFVLGIFASAAAAARLPVGAGSEEDLDFDVSTYRPRRFPAAGSRHGAPLSRRPAQVT